MPGAMVAAHFKRTSFFYYTIAPNDVMIANMVPAAPLRLRHRMPLGDFLQPDVLLAPCGAAMKDDFVDFTHCFSPGPGTPAAYAVTPAHNDMRYGSGHASRKT